MSAAEVIQFPEVADARALVREYVDSTPDADPTVVAERLIAECDADALHALLVSSLPRLVREVMRDMRHGAGVNPISGSAPKGARPRSKKWDQVAEIFERPMAIGWGDGWKPFGDFTINELHVTAAQRRTLANANARQAKNLNALAKLMGERDVKVVRDLPPMTVRDVLNA